MIKLAITFSSQISFATSLIAGVLIAAGSASAVSDRKIEDARYACETFVEGDSESNRRKTMRQAQVARFWLVSFLTGAYEADEVLEFSEQADTAEDQVIARVKDYCNENATNSIHAAVVSAGTAPTPLPPITAIGLDPRSYSCLAYSEGSSSRGEDKDMAEAAEFWAFAFVQGNVSVRYHPRLVISISNKRKIIRALRQSCARNPTRTLLDQTSEIANRVRPEYARR